MRRRAILWMRLESRARTGRIRIGLIPAFGIRAAAAVRRRRRRAAPNFTPSRTTKWKLKPNVGKRFQHINACCQRAWVASIFADEAIFFFGRDGFLSNEWGLWSGERFAGFAGEGIGAARFSLCG